MDSIEVEPVSPDIEITSDQPIQSQENESVENFEKFIYELFEKNGILSDLRAYLRRHIVNLLKNAQLGETPPCQKHFAQRLELPTQAMNILIAEYLLRLEFSYSLSVFISEIPLANMVFDFAGCMMRGDAEESNLRFNEKDVCSILNYLGIKCDAEHVAEVIDMYKNSEHTPLLVCILKNMTMYQPNGPLIEDTISVGSVSSAHSSDTLSEAPKKSTTFLDKCRHYSVCRTCHNKLTHLREKYKKRKRDFIKKGTSINSMNVKAVMKNISAIEGTLTDEMMEQVKSVYEAEVELVRAEEERRVKRSLASHAIQLQHQKQELEETFKAREEELESNVRAKKKFLWGLARSLRNQHEQMTRAMNALRCQTRRLTAKEDSLKNHLVEAEQVLRHRSESIRSQISGELLTLEGQLSIIKQERDSIQQERTELEHMKLQGSKPSLEQHDRDMSSEIHSFYELKNELANLKKYIETTRIEPKNLTDRCTITDLHGVSSKISIEMLNNEQDARMAREEDRLKANQLVNDFKKQKNVNFNVSTPGEDSSSAEALPLSAASPAATILQLRHENERLRQFASQQRVQLEQLGGAAARLQAAAEGWRPHTAPDVTPGPPGSRGQQLGFNVNPTLSSNSFGWRKGAGEELCCVGGPGVRGTRVLVPGDTLPFIGVIRDRHADTRRHMISQWRALRRASPPPRPRPRPPSPAQRDIRPNSAGASVSVVAAQRLHDTEPTTDSDQAEPELLIIETRMEKCKHRGLAPGAQHREKSPKSVLREAKEKLRTKANTKYSVPSTSSREKSPSSVLREAKLRLRKLEIEAEAVEKSYLDFRKRQSKLRGEHSPTMTEENAVTKDTGDLSIKRSRSLHKIDQEYNTAEMNRVESEKIAQDDFDRYLREYHAKFDLSDTHFHRNLNTTTAKPIPEAYSTRKADAIEPSDFNYLDTPINEFRKYYRPQTSSSNQTLVENDVQRPMSPNKNETRPKSPLRAEIATVETDKANSNTQNEEKDFEAKKEALLKAKNCKQMELEILKRNINRMYNIQDSSYIEVPVETPEHIMKTEDSQVNVTFMKEITKNLMIEVENVNNINEINVVGRDKPPNLLVEVQSRVDAEGNTHSDSEPEGGEKMCGNMTILISPKRSEPEDTAGNRAKSPDNSRRSVSPEQAARLTRNDVFEAIFHADPLKATSSFEIHPISSKDGVDDASEVERDVTEDYPDDFSADVDNYNTFSDKNSPISLPKSPTDDRDFWDN